MSRTGQVLRSFSCILSMILDWLERLTVRFERMPRQLREKVIIGVCQIAICFGFCLFIGLPRIAAQSESAKDVQQDMHLSFDDAKLDETQKKIRDLEVSREERHKELQEWKDQTTKVINDQKNQITHDEGLAIGAFIVIGFLQSIGLLRSFRKGDKDDDKD